MNGEDAFPMKGLGAETFYVAGSFCPNGASNPNPALNRYGRGFIWTVVRSGVGLYTVTLDPSMNIPGVGPIYADSNAQCATLATDWFNTLTVGEFSATTRQIIIQAHRTGVAQEVAGTTGNRINFSVYFRNSTGA